jgi:hydrogenase maturation protease
MTRILVAGIGNIFLSDDGFGVEVVRRLASKAIPEGVTVSDFGIRGIHLAYELLQGYDRLILIDALARGEAPGTLSVLKPDQIGATGALPDAHGMEPMAVFGYLASIGGDPVPTIILGCEPETLEESIGLSPTVERSVDAAVDVALGLIHDAINASSLESPAAAG